MSGQEKTESDIYDKKVLRNKKIVKKRSKEDRVDKRAQVEDEKKETESEIDEEEEESDEESLSDIEVSTYTLDVKFVVKYCIV
jgi:hypothetical protein